MDKWYIKHIFLFVVVIGIISSNALANSQHILIGVPELSDSIVTAGDVLNVGVDQLIVAQGTQIDIYLDGKIVSSITDFSGNVTALATGDLTGNFCSELIIGTENAAFYIYQYQEGTWIRLAEHRHLWAPISQLLVDDITGNGWGDVVVMNSRGELFVFLSFQGELDIFWRSKAGNNVQLVEVADLNGDGAAEVILTLQSGQVAILSWVNSELDIVWENYPWGSIEGLMVGKINASQKYPELMVISSQGIFYSWQWTGSDFVGTRRFAQPLKGNFTYLDSLGLLNFSNDQGISLYKVSSTSLTHQWEVIGVKAIDILEVNQRKLVKDSSYRYYWLETLDTNAVTVYFDSVLQREHPEVLYVGDQLYLPLHEGAKMLGWTVLGNRRIFVTKGLDYLIIEPDSDSIRWNNMSLPVKFNTIKHNASIYVPIDFFSMLGYDIEFDITTLELNIDKIRTRWFW